MSTTRWPTRTLLSGRPPCGAAVPSLPRAWRSSRSWSRAPVGTGTPSAPQCPVEHPGGVVESCDTRLGGHPRQPGSLVQRLLEGVRRAGAGRVQATDGGGPLTYGVPGHVLVLTEQHVGDARTGAEVLGHDQGRVRASGHQGGCLAQRRGKRGRWRTRTRRGRTGADDRRDRRRVGPTRLDPPDVGALAGAQRLERAEPDVRAAAAAPGRGRRARLRCTQIRVAVKSAGSAGGVNTSTRHARSPSSRSSTTAIVPSQRRAAASTRSYPMAASRRPKDSSAPRRRRGCAPGTPPAPPAPAAGSPGRRGRPARPASRRRRG